MAPYTLHVRPPRDPDRPLAALNEQSRRLGEGGACNARRLDDTRDSLTGHHLDLWQYDAEVEPLHEQDAAALHLGRPTHTRRDVPHDLGITHTVRREQPCERPRLYVRHRDSDTE